MRVRNITKISISFPFAGVTGSRVLRAGALSPQLPATRFYDPLLQRALKRKLISVEFDKEDVGIVGLAGIPGPVAQALSVLNPSEPEPEKSDGVVTKPAPVVVVTKPLPGTPEPRKPKRTAGQVAKAKVGMSRASTIANRLKVPFHVLAATLGKKTGTTIYPVTNVSAEDEKWLEEKFASSPDAPELSDIPRVQTAQARSISELSSDMGGVLSLADLAAENGKLQ